MYFVRECRTYAFEAAEIYVLFIFFREFSGGFFFPASAKGIFVPKISRFVIAFILREGHSQPLD